MRIFKHFTFAAAHKLVHVPPGHKCANLHGHTYKLEVHLTGPVDEHIGWVTDFGDVKAAVKPYLDMVDHAYLNDIPDLEKPTAELIAKWFWDKLKPELPTLSEVVIWENESSGACYAGE